MSWNRLPFNSDVYFASLASGGGPLVISFTPFARGRRRPKHMACIGAGADCQTQGLLGFLAKADLYEDFDFIFDIDITILSRVARGFASTHHAVPSTGNHSCGNHHHR